MLLDRQCDRTSDRDAAGHHIMAILPADYFIPDFPEQVWDGLSGSPKRYHPRQFEAPDGYDYSKISAEVIAIEQYLFDAGPAVSTIQRNAAEPISALKWVKLTTGGNELVPADNSQNAIAGILLHSVDTGQSGICLSYGLLTLDDWIATAGSVFLTPGKSYFLAENGLMSLAPPTTGHIIKLGRATSTTTFVVDVTHVVKL